MDGTAPSAGLGRRSHEQARSHGSRAVALRLFLGHGHPGDHPAIYRSLRSIFQAPSRDRFRTILDQPGYEPYDWLLLRHGMELFGQALTLHRVMWFGGAAIPIGGVAWLGIAPQVRSKGHAAHMLRAAERHLTDQGALFALLRTSVPDYFRRFGWTERQAMPYSEAPARLLLAGLMERFGPVRITRKGLNIRPARRWEVDALARLYAQNLGGSYGLTERSEAYWQWLLRCQAHDQLIVASRGADQFDAERGRDSLLGYAVLRRCQIVEMMTAPAHRDTACQLVARVCKDAIERDVHDLVLHAPEGHPLHKIFRAADGHDGRRSADREASLMIKVLQPAAMLKALEPEFRARLEGAKVSLPVELGLSVGRARYQLVIDENEMHVGQRRMGRNHLDMAPDDFARLLIGQGQWASEAGAPGIRASTPAARRLGRVLLPNAPFWNSTWDELAVFP